MPGWIQAGIRIGGRNINNLRHADDITLMAENKERLKNPSIRVKEKSEKASLKLNIKNKTKQNKKQKKNPKLRSWHPAPKLHGK